jgi:hypothetical protein
VNATRLQGSQNVSTSVGSSAMNLHGGNRGLSRVRGHALMMGTLQWPQL